MITVEAGPEQRRDLRRRRRHRVRVEPGGLEAVTNDVSLGGAFLLTTREWPPGQRLQLTFVEPNQEVHVQGLVRWTRLRPDPRQEPAPVGVGVEFVEPDAGVSDLL